MADFERYRSIWERLYEDRIIFLGTQINDEIANQVVAHLLYMESQDPEKDIFLYINSPGGSVTAGMAIYDTMQFIRAPVSTICIGQAASMAAVLLAAGEKGKRRILPNARVMIHQPLGGARGQASDIEITAKEILRWKDVLTHVLAKHSGQDYDKVKNDSDRDYFLGAHEAKEYGLIDQVLEAEEEDTEG
ncbi:MAG: ATP-dependent Clp protease proteolytic subunit [Proteobacteria bacterium]|nr:ATP-dependent Clp protease proteolytic subunit [Pseudomonadota bacterium]MCP4920713.1 ATP-dependent Clp protease proteolytic subunit [Pseudomonadota bacterium]